MIVSYDVGAFVQGAPGLKEQFLIITDFGEPLISKL
jgi:hypothetical protein